MMYESIIIRLLNSSIARKLGLALLLAVLLAAINPSILRLLVSLLLLLLPGYGMTVVLFPEPRLGTFERLLFSLGLSALITVLSGLILHLTPWGIRTSTLSVALLGWLLAEAAVIARRENLQVARSIAMSVRLFNSFEWLLLGWATLIVMAAIYVAREPAPPQGLEGYTLLWLQPADSPEEVHIGVRSEEFTPTNYQLRLQVGDALQEGPRIQLQPGESWESSFRAPPDLLDGGSVTVFLYRLDQPAEVYRKVVWWPNAPQRIQRGLS